MNIIAAVDQEWGIGNDGDLLFHIHSDLMEFKNLTQGRVVVLGRTTLSTFPNGKALKNRTNIVLSSNHDYAPENTIVCHSINELFIILQQYNSSDIFIIGGDSVYKQLLPYCDKAYITKVYKISNKDTWFPNLDKEQHWHLANEGILQEEEGILFKFTEYKNSKVLDINLV